MILATPELSVKSATNPRNHDVCMCMCVFCFVCFVCMCGVKKNRYNNNMLKRTKEIIDSTRT